MLQAVFEYIRIFLGIQLSIIWSVMLVTTTETSGHSTDASAARLSRTTPVTCPQPEGHFTRLLTKILRVNTTFFRWNLPHYWSGFWGVDHPDCRVG